MASVKREDAAAGGQDPLALLRAENDQLKNKIASLERDVEEWQATCALLNEQLTSSEAFAAHHDWSLPRESTSGEKAELAVGEASGSAQASNAEKVEDTHVGVTCVACEKTDPTGTIFRCMDCESALVLLAP